MKAFKVHIELYGRKVIVCIGGNSKKVRRLLKKEGIGNKELRKIDLSDCDGYTYMLPSGLTLLWLQKAPKTPYFRGILSHECLHCTDMILDFVGVNREGNSESHAYLLGYLVEQIYKKC